MFVDWFTVSVVVVAAPKAIFPPFDPPLDSDEMLWVNAFVLRSRIAPEVLAKDRADPVGMALLTVGLTVPLFMFVVPP